MAPASLSVGCEPGGGIIAARPAATFIHAWPGSPAHAGPGSPAHAGPGSPDRAGPGSPRAVAERWPASRPRGWRCRRRVHSYASSSDAPCALVDRSLVARHAGYLSTPRAKPQASEITHLHERRYTGPGSGRNQWFTMTPTSAAGPSLFRIETLFEPDVRRVLLERECRGRAAERRCETRASASRKYQTASISLFGAAARRARSAPVNPTIEVTWEDSPLDD